MNMKNDVRQKKQKKYEKPTLHAFSLAAKEVLAVGCKVNAGDSSGELGLGCGNIVCNTPGS